MEKRYEELDSLRGVAAILVFIFHILMILPSNWKEGLLWQAINFSPLHHLFIGDKRVIFFYILSGFVLSLPFLTKNSFSYPSFIIRRIVRLYIPYAVAITFTIISCIVFSKGSNSELGGLFNILWMEPAEVNLILNHYLFLGNYNVYAYNISIWSLIHELRISLIFPILMVLALRFSWKINLAIGVLLAVIGAAIHLILQDPYQPIYKSLFYILMFIIGILLSKNRLHILERYKTFSKRSKIGLIVIGVMFYNYSDFIGNPLLADWITSLGVSILFIIALGSATASKFLLLAPFRYLGKFSYGIYLYHLPILLILLNVYYGKLHLFIIICLAVIITLLFAKLAWYFVEKPSIKLSKFLSKKFSTNLKQSIFVDGKRSGI